MKDQVESLPPRLRTLATALVSGGDAAGMQSIMDGIAGRRFRLVYCSPERLRSRSFVSLLASAGVTRLVVDEAHCVSVWGHDFRPDYLHLQRAHADMGAPPILALTATAAPTVREDIERYLLAASRGGRTRRTLAGNPARPNLWLGAQAVSDEQDKLRRLASLCRTLVGSGIVYVRTRAQADDLAALLREERVDAAAYHAGLDKRAAVQERFMRGQVRIVVATIAFGMGIDKADIRFVLHSGVPASPESYSQEIGRAGRDSQPATCLVVYHDRDLESAKALAQRETVDMELLHRLHGEIARRLGERRSGVLPMEETTARLGGDEIAVKVALSMLEQGKLIERHYDAPRTIRLYLRKVSRGAQFQQMLRAAGLASGHPVEWRFMDLSDAAGIEATQLEDRLLHWQEQGFLSVYPAGRDPLITLRAAPHDADNRIERLIRDRKSARLRRAEEMVRYINASTCRAAALAEYFGIAESAPCRNCDRCGIPLTQIFR
jgi:ATP-dependent DNA helicase RecQ